MYDFNKAFEAVRPTETTKLFDNSALKSPFKIYLSYLLDKLSKPFIQIFMYELLVRVI